MHRIAPLVALAALLAAAGSGAALAEAVDQAAALARAQADATYAYVWESVDRAEDVVGPASDLAAGASAGARSRAADEVDAALFAAQNVTDQIAQIAGSGLLASGLSIVYPATAAAATCASDDEPATATLACQAALVAFLNAVIEA